MEFRSITMMSDFILPCIKREQEISLSNNRNLDSRFVKIQNVVFTIWLQVDAFIPKKNILRNYLWQMNITSHHNI